MCEPIRTVRFETLDVKDTDAVRPIIDAAFSVADSTCCSMRKNAISAAVFAAARDLGYRVAWGSVLDDDGPDFILWPADSIHRATVRDYLERKRANEITGRNWQAMRANLDARQAVQS